MFYFLVKDDALDEQSDFHANHALAAVAFAAIIAHDEGIGVFVFVDDVFVEVEMRLVVDPNEIGLEDDAVEISVDFIFAVNQLRDIKLRA